MGKKIFLSICFMILVVATSGICHAQTYVNPLSISGNNTTNQFNIAVAGNVTAYSNSIKLDKGVYYGLQYRAMSTAGSPDVTIQIEESSIGAPRTEGSADTRYVVPEGAADVYANLTDENWHIESLSLVPAKYFRLKLVGNAANESDVSINGVLTIQEFD